MEEPASSVADGETATASTDPRRAEAAQRVRSTALAWALVALGTTAAIGALWLARQRSVLDPDRLPLPPAALVERAREVLAATTGWSAGGPSAHGFEYAEDYLSYLDLIPELEQRRRTRRAGPVPVTFWYRQSPERLLPSFAVGLPKVGFDRPAVGEPGEVAVRLDAEGRLLELRRWPRATETRQREEAWEPVFAAAGLELGSFRELYPRFVPPVPTDARFQWTGETALYPDEEVEAVGGTVEGRPTFFRYAGAWRTRVPPPVHDLSTLPRGGLVLLVALAGVVAWRHRRSGAAAGIAERRVAFAAFAVALIATLTSPALPWGSLDPAVALSVVGVAMGWAAVAWLVATALGPRLAGWPGMMAGWQALWRSAPGSGGPASRSEPRGEMPGGARSREVLWSGVLVGVCGGAVLAALAGLSWWVPVRMGQTAVEARPSLVGLAGGGSAVGALLLTLARAALWTSLFALVLELSRLLLRRRLLAALATAAAVLAVHPAWSAVGWVVTAIVAVLWVAILVRWGLLAALLADAVSRAFGLALVPDLGHWAAQTTWLVLALVLGALAVAAWRCRLPQSAIAPAQ